MQGQSMTGDQHQSMADLSLPRAVFLDALSLGPVNLRLLSSGVS